MQVQVIYIGSNIEFVKKINVPSDSSVQNAIEQSGLLEQYADISLENNKVGIFGNIVSLETILQENDRVEVYQPLKMDPMEARRLRSESS
jgi:putative ubiquitin-RnfH superfamily antitoxin RatB of RatAB toxin-antitoxin module